MDSATTQKLLLAIALLLALLYPRAESTWPPRPPLAPPPLCMSQFALVNRACAVLPYRPVPPPSPPSPPVLPPSPVESESRHHHHHHHGRHETRVISPTEGECCRWLREIDSVCVCNLLVHLPPFLTRPVHNYTVWVNSACQVTYQCSSRLVQG